MKTPYDKQEGYRQIVEKLSVILQQKKGESILDTARNVMKRLDKLSKDNTYPLKGARLKILMKTLGRKPALK
jgi:hypothetical protein